MTSKKGARPLVDDALEYARAGFAVFPLSPGTKRPTRGSRGFKDATTNEDLIRRWWKAEPMANIGLPIPDGFVVVDIDQPEPPADVDVPPTAVQCMTPRGLHLWYRTSKPVRPAVGVFPHVDLRGPGSYVVAPPSVLEDGGTYRWRNAFTPSKAGDAPEWVYARRSVLADRDPEQPMGTREELVAFAGNMRAGGATPEAIYTALAAMRNAGQITDLDDTRPWTAQDLKKIATEAGKWNRGEVITPPTVNMAPAVEPSPRGEDSPPTEDESEPWSTALADIEELEPEPLLLGRLDPADHTILFGDGGSGKSLVAASWVAALSAEPLNMPVLIIDYEQHARYEWRPRVRQMGGNLGIVRVVQPEGSLWAEAKAIAAECERFGIRYIVIDSVGYAVGDLETEKSSTATKYSKALHVIGLPALSLAHTTKTDTDPRYPFGSKYWHNGARITMSLMGHDYEPRVLTQKKTNQRSLFAPVQADWSWSETSEAGEVPADLDWSAAGVTLTDRLLAVMAPGEPYPVAELVELVNADGGKETTRDGVNGALRSAKTPFEKVAESHPLTWRVPRIDIHFAGPGVE